MHLIGFFFMNCTMMHGSTNIKFANRNFQVEKDLNFNIFVSIKTYIHYSSRCTHYILMFSICGNP